MATKKKVTQQEQLVEEKEPEQEIAEPLHPALTPASGSIPSGRTAQVEHDPVLRFIAKILANGTQFAGHPQINFPMHQGLLNQLTGTYEQYKQGDEAASERFLKILGDYLEQAKGHLPGAMQYDRVDERIEHIRNLIDELKANNHPDAFHQVACYLLLRAQTLARF